ncbi:nuclear factor NF-kappa-B p100 subunit isoform X1 [Nasonia vitripennis]|uniref:RHD domain-containing protein n=2 Tax=Nasonia vitripennis TaxID=7425 RepID=A0A7M7QKP0_NASVI|nr:nuclear factor NF-kappa-B p100 subunit isoform X1 [Nasonia vitripennis]XP_031787153.1 nuclear factor NF-kappa-B p100 subunit isoform X1 [Nasonia vitripennis]
MPDAYENYSAYSQVQSLTPLTPVHLQPESFFTYNYDQRTMSTAGSFSPSSVESPLMDTCENLNLSTEQVITIIGNPIDQNAIYAIPNNSTELKIVVQPVDKFRFRYKSEMMGTHGSLLGEREETSHKKEVPTAQLINCHLPEAVIRCTLVTADEDRRFPHAHHLVKKDGNSDKDDPHDINVSRENNYTAMFCNMGIIHTAKKNIKEEIMRKRKIEVMEEKKRKNFENPVISTREDLEMKMEAEKAQKWMNLNSVALCFQGFAPGANDVLIPITEKVYSRPINNLKSALTGELKICRIDKHTSSCEGNEEVWLLVEKVGKKNIKVIFYEVDEKDNTIWSAEGRFSELDVHHQYAIVFKTPSYKDVNITQPVEVLLKLERPSDGETSNSITFVYKPSDKVLNRKRPRLSTSGSMEFAHSPVPAPQLDICMPMAETCINLGEENISNLSGEIKKLLNDGQHCNSADLDEFLKDNSSLEKFYNLLPSNFVDGVDTDGGGPTEFERSQQDFANDSLRKVTNVLKEADGTPGSKRMTIDKIQDLLQESTIFGDTPLHFSLRHEQFDTAKYLLLILGSDPSFKAIVNMQNSAQKTPLHMAVLQNQADIVRALLRLGADPNLCDEEDASSLHNAVIVNANACIDELLKSNVKLNLEAHTEAGWSALHLAAKVGSLHAVKALIEAGADVNSTDMSYGRTALHIAVDSNHKHIVEYLLTKTNIHVNTKNFGGNTALHSAVVKGGKCAEELIKILKKHGADPQIRNNNINRDEEDEDNSLLPPIHTPIDSSATPTIKSESSDSEDDAPRPGESSFDLAKGDPKLMQLLSEGKPDDPIQEELDLKEESEDEMMLQDRAILQASRTFSQGRRISTQERPAVQPTVTKTSPTTKPQLQPARPGDEKLSDAHVNRILHILDRTGGWERLAQHTNHGSLVRLYKKMKSPSKALFVKIRLQNPDITVRQVKKLLIEVQAFEAATALETGR